MLEGKNEEIKYEITLLKMEIKSEMQLKHQALDSIDQFHAQKLSLLEKIVFSAVGFITLSFLGAIITLVLK